MGMETVFNMLSNPVPDEVRQNTVLMVVAGSRALGCQTVDSSDEDYMGVFVEPKEAVLGLRQYDYWEGATSDKDVRKGHGDVEVKMHGLKKFVSLAAKGNPDVLGVLYAPLVGEANGVGKMLRENAGLFSSKLAGRRYLGYMNGQMKSLNTGVGMEVKRPELVEKYGYDVKFAYHVLRLGQQGIDFLANGKLVLPLPEAQRAYLMDVRAGKYTLSEVTEQARELDEKLKAAIELSSLPDAPDRDQVNTLLMQCYEYAWYGQE
jgi:predicted nucleotidyltransferase